MTLKLQPSVSIAVKLVYSRRCVLHGRHRLAVVNANLLGHGIRCTFAIGGREACNSVEPDPVGKSGVETVTKDGWTLWLAAVHVVSNGRCSS